MKRCRVLLPLVLLLAMPALAAADQAEAVCPVCRVHEGETDPEPVRATAVFEGETYSFCSEDCRDTFLEAPESYLPPVFPRPAPAFTVHDLEGGELRSSELQGRAVLLDFWATWCQPCVADLPKLSRLHERYGDGAFTVLSVSIDEGDDAPKKVARMMKKRKVSHPVYLDTAEPSAWAAYLVRVVPAQFLIDAQGNVVAQWSGKIDFAEVEAEIVRLLGQ